MKLLGVETLTAWRRHARLRSICLTGYTEERDSIYEMIWAAGGRHTGRLTKAASHLVRPPPAPDPTREGSREATENLRAHARVSTGEAVCTEHSNELSLTRMGCNGVDGILTREGKSGSHE